ncbi:hypothetical protein [Cryobacterium sp. Hh38]|uniref:hypothetical protein n=1 Tax=Cryobacterium sp. Hh38 TaxID=1259156 RepID=UPI0018E06B68|nr:hypothetical protein [Cryobacterium sp. Hh38]
MKLNLKAVEERVAPMGSREAYDREFIFELLLAYGRSQSNITRLRNGSLNVAEDKTHDVAQKNWPAAGISDSGISGFFYAANAGC